MINPQILLSTLHRQLHPISQWLEDRSVTELMVNPGGHVYVESSGVISYKGQLLSENAIFMALTTIAKIMKRDAIADSSDSIINASLEDLRFAGGLMPVSSEGSFFTIRKHKHKDDRPTLHDLIHNMKALTQEQADLIIDLVITQKKNCMIAGSTGSGKTTITNALLSQIPHEERIVTIEDSRELQLDVPNWVPLITNERNNITSRTLVQLAMRLYPGRLILGETRGQETYDLIRAFNSGHDGSISTIHASSAESSLEALEMLYQMNLPAGASMPAEVARQYIAKCVNVVVFCGRRNQMVDGVLKVVRRVEQICLIKGVKDGMYQIESV
jgi:pilus assembly protein CpaF